MAYGADRISTDQLSTVIKANYTPSSVEVGHVLEWLDISKVVRNNVLLFEMKKIPTVTLMYEP